MKQPSGQMIFLMVVEVELVVGSWVLFCFGLVLSTMEGDFVSFFLTGSCQLLDFWSVFFSAELLVSFSSAFSTFFSTFGGFVSYLGFSLGSFFASGLFSFSLSSFFSGTTGIGVSSVSLLVPAFTLFALFSLLFSLGSVSFFFSNASIGLDSMGSTTTVCTTSSFPFVFQRDHFFNKISLKKNSSPPTIPATISSHRIKLSHQGNAPQQVQNFAQHPCVETACLLLAPKGGGGGGLVPAGYLFSSTLTLMLAVTGLNSLLITLLSSITRGEVTSTLGVTISQMVGWLMFVSTMDGCWTICTLDLLACW